jgi:alpha/beta superfamily hydrolase
MQSHLLRKMSWRLPALADIAVLRFNTRGTTSPDGTSEGTFDNGYLEGLDLNAAIDWAAARGLPDPWLVGWSFGTDVILRHGNRPPVRGAILLSPPLRTITESELSA